MLLFATLVSLILVLFMMPVYIIRAGYSVGYDIVWIVRHHYYVYTTLHGSFGEFFSGLTVISGLLGFIFGLGLILISYVFLLLSFHKEKMIIIPYVFTAFSIIVITTSFIGINLLMIGRHCLDLGFNIAYLSVPVTRTWVGRNCDTYYRSYSYYYTYCYDIYDYVTLDKTTTIPAIVINSLFAILYSMISFIVVIPMVLFVAALIFLFIKDKKPALK